MMFRKHLSPAFVVALVALFVSLGGTAVAAGIVPLAKRALTADTAKQADVAKKLSAAASSALTQQAGQLPGPASTAAGLVSVKSAPFSLAASGGSMFTAPCGSGEKALSGGFGYDSSALVLSVDSLPTPDGSGWQIYLINLSTSSGASGTVYAMCLR
jgi:hypothetical protein